MIGKVIGKEGEKGSGGGVEAFAPGVSYVCGKATRVEMRNIASSDWQDAAAEMVLTSELSERVKKPYYHLVLSWHPQEKPTEDQMFEAADHMIKSLGLEDHQVVIGTHFDTERNHIHIIANTVHPTTGLVWSKSQDKMRVEKACREIEIKQGWSHDRGRFDFEVNTNGQVNLKPNTKVWEKKKKDRVSGKRPKTSGDRKFEKSSGFVTFEHGIPDALKEKFTTIVGEAFDWHGLHIGLGEIGLTYYKSGSGARVGMIGSDEFAKASAFGSKFSITRMQESFGEYKDPKSVYANDLKPPHKDIEGLSGSISNDDLKATTASSFKVTLLRRIYTEIHIEQSVATAIRFVALADHPPQITFWDGTTVVDHGSRMSTSKSTSKTRAAMIAMAKSKKWSSVSPSGSPSFVRDMALECARAGLSVHGVPDDVQVMADAILEHIDRAERRIEIEARAAEKASLEAVTDRDSALMENDERREERARHEVEMTAEVQSVLDALGFRRGAVHTAIRTVAKEEKKRIKADLPDRRVASSPQPAPDADRADHSGKRKIASQLRVNDQQEIEDIKSIDIAIIASVGGWTDETRAHADRHGDKAGARYRTYTRGSDTIKCTRKNGRWLWTSNKNLSGGSTLDLWLYDNPGKTIGDARKAFRNILGTTTPIIAPFGTDRRQEEQRDHTVARQRWEQAPYISGQRTYAEDRGISRRTLMRYKNQVRGGVFGGVYFAHRNVDTGDIQGFEQRWEKDGKANTARFAKGGLKTACVLGDPKAANRMVVFEGGLDALALAEIEARDDTIYVSTGGGFGERTEETLKALADGKKVLSGFDNDPAGEAMSKRVQDLLSGAARLAPPSHVEGASKQCNDWLDVLNARKSLPPGYAFTPAEREVPEIQSSVDYGAPECD